MGDPPETEPDPYWELYSDDEREPPQGRGVLPRGAARRIAASIAGGPSRAARPAECEGGASAALEELQWRPLLVEFFRAVVPLACFVVVYIGLLLEEWVLTWEMAGGLCCVIVGLAVFKYGLMTGLMPFGESIGRRLPQKAAPSVVFLASLLLGVLVTFSEPGINSLQLVGEILQRRGALAAAGRGDAAGASAEATGPSGARGGEELLVRVLSPEKSFELLSAVACGVGVASACGLLRLQRSWSIKPVIFASTVPLLCLTAACWQSEELSKAVGLAWDCGAITTGPATVPIVLSLGIGAAQASRQNAPAAALGSSELDGFGIVTLASLVPVTTVLAFCAICSTSTGAPAEQEPVGSLEAPGSGGAWSEFPLLQLWEACRSVGPLAAFLVLVQGLLVRERPHGVSLPQLFRGVVATLLGLFVFNIGLSYGSVPLGEASGASLPRALDADTRLSRWGLVRRGGVAGEFLVMLFGFLAGFMATVIDLEPCGLGETVERLSGGKFTKTDLIGSVATGVGLGVVLGLAKVLHGLNLLLVLVVGYAAALLLSLGADEGICCVAWDSAGVTTGPVTVPLVLSMGVGICGRLGSADGFGILACASVCPIIAVLATSIVRRALRGSGARAEGSEGVALVQVELPSGG